jgi:hypothetical protein
MKGGAYLVDELKVTVELSIVEAKKCDVMSRNSERIKF